MMKLNRTYPHLGLLYENSKITMIRNGWKTYKLGEIAEIQNGYAFKSKDFTVKGTPVIKIKNIVPPRILFTDCGYYDGGISDYLKKYVIQKNDILISMTGSHFNQIESAVGKVGRYQHGFNALLNQRVGKLFSLDKKVLNEDYLYYFISRPEVQIELVSGAGGSANQANISPDQIKALRISLPNTISEQSRIASILLSLDAKIELNLQMNKTLEAIAQAIFKEWFVDFRYPGVESEHKDGLPEGWKRGKLGDYCKIYRGASPRPITDPKYFSNGTVPWIKISDATAEGSFYITKTKEYCTELAVSKSRFIKRGTLVLSNSATVGVPMILDLDGCVHDGWLIFDDYTGISKNFLFYTLLSNSQKLISMADGSVQKNLNTGILKNLDIVIPDESSVKRFNTISTALFDRILANERENQVLKGIRDTLLPKLMTGEILIN